MNSQVVPDRRPLARRALRAGLIGVVTLMLTLAGLLFRTDLASAAPPGYVAKSALINADSITGGVIVKADGSTVSLEQYAAERAGFTVTVVSGNDWDAMAASDFAKYQVLVIGDPTCSTIPTSATANSSTWAPVVMGQTSLNPTVGNRTLIGTDPAYHYQYGGGAATPSDPTDPSTAGAEHLVQSGIAYAGGVVGATGAYVDTSCFDDGAGLLTLNQLSASGAGFTEDTSPPCGGDVAIIAANPVFNQVSYTDIQGWGCSVHTTYPTYPSDWQPLAVATDTVTKPTCGTNTKDGTTACGEAYVLVAGRGIVASAPDLKLTPATDSAPAGGSHTVTATVTDNGNPVSGVLVGFTVTGQNNGATGTCAPASCTTGSNGQVTFTYTDTKGAGDDTIAASATINGTSERATATMTWTAAANQPPTADNKNVATNQNTAVGITLTGSDPDGDALTYTVLTNPTHGTLSGTAPNLTYTPTTGYSGPDSFTYKVNDGKADSNTATVSITVTKPTGCAVSAPTLDAQVTANQASPSTTFTSPAITTGGGGRLLLAYVSSDGPNRDSSQYVRSVTGGGLSWTLVSRSNLTWGTSEVWQAYAASAVSAAKVTATLASAYDGSIIVQAYAGADTKVAAATANSSKGSTKPSATVTAKACKSLVTAVGHDWTHASPVTPVSGQSLVQLFRDTKVHDSSWVQKVDAPTSSAGATVTVSDTLNFSDRWTMVAVVIQPAP